MALTGVKALGAVTPFGVWRSWPGAAIAGAQREAALEREP